MWLWDLLTGKDRGHDVAELARRLGVREEELRAVPLDYREFTIPKASGGKRRILAPNETLKALQRRILHRLLGRLRSHPAATGFERGHSIATNARRHAGRAVVMRMDVKSFFESTRADRIQKYFRKIGWNKAASRLLTKLTTYDGGLPQGAPTSPRLSNLVNYGLDARLAGMAVKVNAEYTRYADDMTFSFGSDDPDAVHAVIRLVKHAAGDEGYEVHRGKKLHVRRQNARQIVTGLVVNQRVNLMRDIRRWLRAVEHHIAKGRQATLTPKQLAGWRSLQAMVVKQSAPQK